MLLRIKRALRTRRDLANWVWLANTILETTLPAIAVAFISSASIDPAYQPAGKSRGVWILLVYQLVDAAFGARPLLGFWINRRGQLPCCCDASGLAPLDKGWRITADS